MLKRATFPDGFAWGAATSSYQVEGAWREGGKGESIWDRFAHTPGAILDGSSGDTACDQLHRYPEDVALLGELGLGAYRFSISWPRVVPAADGSVSRAGLDYYDRLVDALLAAGITPYPTLYHWDLPVWMQDAGGWADRAVIGRFAEYADVVVRALGDRIATWTVLNEPEVFVTHGHLEGVHAPGLRDLDLTLRASHVVNLAHAEGVRAVRAAAPRANVGSAFNMDIAYPATGDPRDAAAAERHHAWVNAWYLDPLVRGRYPVAFVDQEAALARMDIRAGDMASMATTFDFIALNMYSRAVVADDPTDTRFGLRRIQGPGRTNDFGWEIWPAALHKLVRRVDEDYDHPPIFITENGCADNTAPGADGRIQDASRVRYLEDHLGQLARAIEDGCDVRGYFAWSLLDNFEWAAGYTQRFGIVWVDVEDAGLPRTIKASGYRLRDIATGGELLYDDALA
ncbi:MAG TPA: GH1 family beta-glucosidase [Candidatus Limnocylindrales bacterium]|nr:GH1 family beta-glucosidase [Candidatus Limnocylindrales bacterium]